jgi:hypothetical protein
MAWFPEKYSTLYDRLTAEKKRIQIQLNGLDLALREIKKDRHLQADREVKEHPVTESSVALPPSTEERDMLDSKHRPICPTCNRSMTLELQPAGKPSAKNLRECSFPRSNVQKDQIPMRQVPSPSAFPA